MSINQPVIYERQRAVKRLFGATFRYTQEYWPPATGHAEHISAIAVTTGMLTKQTPARGQPFRNRVLHQNERAPNQPNIMTGAPPEVTPMMKTPDNADQQVTILQLNPEVRFA